MIYECGGLKLADMVLYNDSNKGWVPAVVETIFKPAVEKSPPELALVVLVTGYHNPSYGVARAKHGKEKQCWLTRAEVKAEFDEAEILKKKQEANAAAALKQMEDLQKKEEPEKQEATAK